MTAAPAPYLAGLAPVDLSELDRVAALRTRYDRKYLVPAHAVDELVSRTGADVGILDIDGRRNFQYESVYFDTPELDGYLSAARRRPKRFKVRTRAYLDAHVAFLEAKTRQGRGLTEKHRIRCRFDERDRLTPDGLDFLSRFDAVAPHAERLQPTLTTRYRRTTLLDPAGTSRITVDTGLEWETSAGGGLGLPHLALIETKSDGRPTTFDRSLWAAGYRPVKVSKYATGLAALDASLPANKWHRVLRTYFCGAVEDRPSLSGTSAAIPLRAGCLDVHG